MSLEWERLEREAAFEGRVFSVVRDTVRVQVDGEERVTRWDVVRHPGAVAVVPLFDDGTVAMVRQFRYPVEDRILEIPAGTRDSDEPWEACAARELEEEVGWRGSRWTALATIYTTPGFCDEEMRLFLAEGLSAGESALDSDEHLEVERMAFEDALERIAAGEVRDAKSIVGLHLARERLRSESRWPPS
ncbi:MAG TPA: NUDIX hydrolase [Gemmatimonadota bacterium]|nr:NUDIX hydrolase [Gemmatimonadota bacterium]